MLLLTHLSMFQFVLICHICLLFDGFPWSLVLVGILCHICYGSLMITFPVIPLCSVGFLAGSGNKNKLL